MRLSGRLRWVLLIPLAGMLFVPAEAPSASRKKVEPLLHWFPAAESPATADSAFAALGDTLRVLTDLELRGFAHYLRFTAAMTLGHVDTMRVEAESSMVYMPDASPLYETAYYLASRRMMLDVAESNAERFVAFQRSVRDTASLVQGLRWLAYVQQLRGANRRAVATLESLLAWKRSDDQWALSELGQAYARDDDAAHAREMLERSLAVFPQDTARAREARAVLDSLDRAAHRSTSDRERRIAAGLEASRHRYYFESHRDGRLLPKAQLVDLRDGVLRDPGLGRGLVVVYFWATWCGPCRHSIRALQEEFARPRHGPVRLVTINCEHESLEIARQRVAGFARDSSLTFPIFLADSTGAARYGMIGMPMVLVIQDGRSLYRNVGYNALEPVEIQLASLGAGLSDTRP